MKKRSAVIESEIILSDCENYRYWLKRTWHNEKPTLVSILHNPSTTEELLTDQTTNNLQNFAVKNGFGSLIIVNLFAYRDKKPSGLTHRKEEHEKENETYIKQALGEAKKEGDVILVGWLKEKKHIRAKRKVETTLSSYKEKVKCLQDKKGDIQRHPCNLNIDTWTLTDYPFTIK